VVVSIVLAYFIPKNGQRMTPSRLGYRVQCATGAGRFGLFGPDILPRGMRQYD